MKLLKNKWLWIGLSIVVLIALWYRWNECVKTNCPNETLSSMAGAAPCKCNFFTGKKA